MSVYPRHVPNKVCSCDFRVCTETEAIRVTVIYKRIYLAGHDSTSNVIQIAKNLTGDSCRLLTTFANNLNLYAKEPNSNESVCSTNESARGIFLNLISWSSYAHQRETIISSSDSLQLRPFSRWKLLLKERICS